MEAAEDAAAAFGIFLALAEPLFQKARGDHRLDFPGLLDWPLLDTSCSHAHNWFTCNEVYMKTNSTLVSYALSVHTPRVPLSGYKFGASWRLEVG